MKTHPLIQPRIIESIYLVGSENEIRNNKEYWKNYFDLYDAFRPISMLIGALTSVGDTFEISFCYKNGVVEKNINKSTYDFFEWLIDEMIKGVVFEEFLQMDATELKLIGREGGYDYIVKLL